MCIVTSDELEDSVCHRSIEQLRIQPGQLRLMTGIHERRYWDPGYTVTQGATAAALKALRDSSVPADALDMLIYAGVCREHFEPATACHVGAGLQQGGSYRSGPPPTSTT